MQNYEQIFAQVERPFAWLDFNALDENIQFIKKACGHKTIRIATKSIRSVDVLRYIQKQLPDVVWMTFTAAETLYLIDEQFDHFLIGYPVMEPYSIRKLLQSGRDVTFMVDHKQQLQLLNTIASELQTTVKVCVDLNVSTDYKLLYFGTKRSPIHSIQSLQPLIEFLLTLPNVQVVGAMGYDGQIAGIADYTKTPFDVKGKLIRTLKSNSAHKVISFRQQAVAHLRHYFPLQFVNAGGSGSMQFTSEQPEVTEITVGSAFYAPALFDHYETLQLKPAAGFALRITRQFSPTIAVAHGGGYIASGATGADRTPTFVKQNELSFLPLEGAGEVQSPIQMPKHALQIGDTVYLRHAKAGELCERFNVLHTVRGKQYAGPIKTYRGDGQCFL